MTTSAQPGSAPGPDVVVAIDGPAGAGKSTVALGVASRAGLRYLDTGSTYRALTLALLRQGVALDDPAAVAGAAAGVKLDLQPAPDHPGVLRVWLDGEMLLGELRSREVNAGVSPVSAVPAVREQMVALQREVMAEGGIVAEGRDVGSTVWPEAQVKVFLTASPDERARRRSADEGEAAGAALAERDRIDSTRTASPTRAAPDAVLLDSTGRPAGDVIDQVLRLVQAARAQNEAEAGPPGAAPPGAAPPGAAP
jgi:cytidylate kinase